MQFFILAELCDQHYRLLCEKLPYSPKLEEQPIIRHGFCFHHETPYEACSETSKHFVYLVVEPVDLRLMASARGGAAKSEAKAEAARANGAKGGRPSKNPNLFKTANSLHILRITPTDYKVIYADGSPAANNPDGSDALFGSFMEAEIHARSWKPNHFSCPVCRTSNLHTNQREMSCSNCKTNFSFS
jgi:hypothetical protein